MAFTPVEIPIDEALDTDFLVDFRPQTISNFLVITDKLEDLLNNFEIDINNQSIGTDNPINYLRTDSLILDNTGFTFQTGTPSQIIARLSRNTSDQSVFNVDILQVDASLDVDTVTVNTMIVNNGITLGGAATFNSSVTNAGSVRESKENVTVTLTDVSTIATGTITLTSISKQNIFVTLSADSSVYTGGGLVGSIAGISLTIDFDIASPPAQNTEFTIYIVDVIEEGASTSIVNAVNAQGGTGIKLTIDPGTNQATTNTILMHSDLVGQTLTLNVAEGELVRYNSNASFLYIIDGSSNDRLMIKNQVGMNIS